MANFIDKIAVIAVIAMTAFLTFGLVYVLFRGFMATPSIITVG